MLVGRKKTTASSFGPDGRRVGSCDQPKPVSCHRVALLANLQRSNKLFQQGAKTLVRRAPIMNGLSVPAGLQKKFQRPMLKRRAYNQNADEALKQCSLGQRKRHDGMVKLMARAGRGLTFKLPNQLRDGDIGNSSGESDDEEREADKPFEPLQIWTSPHQGGELKGLPPRKVTELQSDGFGNQESVTVIKPAPLEAYRKDHVFVPPVLAKWLRPHQREGVQFMYDCVMGLKDFQGNGCILADDMGLGKTLQSVTLIYTLLKTGITANGQPTAKKVIVVCPCSLVKNWDNEFIKWLGPGCVKTLAIAEADRKSVESSLDTFVRSKMYGILIVSYECLRAHVGRLIKHQDCCDLLVCDEAHRLKNSANQTSKALNSLPVKRRVLLTGTPMQNDLQEFFAMVDFTNPGVLGTQEEFRRNMLLPILRGREPDATEAQKRRMMEIQNDMSSVVNEFILRRINTLNAQHLPPKLVQVVCCNLTEIQQNMYQHLLNSKDMQHILEGKQVNCLGSIQMLMKLCNHPSLVVEDQVSAKPGRRAAANVGKYSDGDKESTITPGTEEISKFLPLDAGRGRRGDFAPVHPEWSGKMFVLYRLLKEMRKPGNGNDKIVIVSNYTQTLDLIGKMCRENSWGFCRLDGSITMKKRQKMVDEFNDPTSSLVAFLLSSKAGGCGLNLIGANRLVLFDPDWNPAVDKQAAARCWRDGQKKRCFTYRFLATGTVEEKIFQRQLSKEGLQSVVDDKEQVNALSTKDLRNLFKLRTGTPSDTHDKLRCERCKIIADNAEVEAIKALPAKLSACRGLLEKLSECEDAAFFLAPLVPPDFGVTKEEYERLVKQPMDLGTVRSRLDLPPDHPSSYKSISGFSKDVNRIFANVMKVWSPGDEISDAARRLQSWWIEQWAQLVPILMTMKPNDLENGRNGTKVDEYDEMCFEINNERKEDYQEQIGMPDEENMRNWSHHYKAETVDDPVFRAALRGFDSVSFVFGLEVTWSLIQQRRQEEEERKAMMELECLKGADVEEPEPNNHHLTDDEELEFSMEENDGTTYSIDENVDANDDMEDSGRNNEMEENGGTSDDEAEFSMGEKDDYNAKNKKDMESRSRNGGSELSMHRAREDSGQADSCHSEFMHDGEPLTGITVNDLDSVGDHQTNRTPSAVVESTTERCMNRSLSVEAQVRSLQSEDNSEKENQSPSNSWACPTCTLHNNVSSRKCDACGSKRPSLSSYSNRKRKRTEVTPKAW